MSRGINIAESVYKSYYESNNSTRKPVVFLSHKSEDKAYVESVGNYLMAAGIDIYLDKNDFQLQVAVSSDNPKKITECIQEGISKCDYILCFVSNNTVRSWWVPYEIGYGKKSNKGISTLIRSNVNSIPEYLKIEEIITNISGINAYIKRITGIFGIPLNECYGWEQRAGDSIEKSSSSHPLSSYLKTF